MKRWILARRRIIAGLCLAFAATATDAAVAAALPPRPQVLTLAVPGGVARVGIARIDGRSTAVLADRAGRTFALALAPDGALRLQPAVAPQPPGRAEMLPDGVVALGTRTIAAAWLVGPTTRYAHGALGDAIEAEGLAVETADGRRLELRLPGDSVFEDLYPRLADLDGDDAILVVRSYLDRGAALAVIKVQAEGLAIVAETPALGRSNRWLNPVGAADFDGDGHIEIALVETPHIGGVLKLYRWENGRLTPVHARSNVTNHVFGSRALGLAAILDADGDGNPDLLILDQSRRRLSVLRYAGDKLAEIAAIPHPSPIVTDIVLADLDGGGRTHAVYALADGTLVALSFGR